MTSPLAADAASLAGPRLPTLPGGTDLHRLRERAREFEAVFLAQMLQPMVQSLDATPPFGGGPAEEMWRSLLADEVGREISRAGGVGIADAVVAQVLANRTGAER